jgi:hypothetical protein
MSSHSFYFPAQPIFFSAQPFTISCAVNFFSCAVIFGGLGSRSCSVGNSQLTRKAETQKTAAFGGKKRGGIGGFAAKKRIFIKHFSLLYCSLKCFFFLFLVVG